MCGGDGVFNPASGPAAGPDIPCNWTGCVDGYVELGQLTLDPGIDDVIDKCNDILDQCADILEAVNG